MGSQWYPNFFFTCLLVKVVLIIAVAALSLTITIGSSSLITDPQAAVNETVTTLRIDRGNDNITLLVLKKHFDNCNDHEYLHCRMANSVITLIDYDFCEQSDGCQIQVVRLPLSVDNSRDDHRFYHSMCHLNFKKCTSYASNQINFGNNPLQQQLERDLVVHRIEFNETQDIDSTYRYGIEVEISHVLNRPRVITIFSFDAKISLRNDSTMETVDEVGLTDVVFLLREGEDVDQVIHVYMVQHFPAFLFSESRNVATVRHELLQQIQLKSEEKRYLTRLAKEAAADVVQIFAHLNIGIGEVVTSFDEIMQFYQASPHGDSAPFLLFNFLTLDVTDINSFRDIFLSDQIVNRIKMEHVVEHLSLPEAIVAFQNCFQYLRPGGVLRIAVPDYSWSMKNCSADDNVHVSDALSDCELNVLRQDRLDKHRVRYSLDSLSAILASVGFQVHRLEWYDNYGDFNSNDWSISDGSIDRSSKGSSSDSSRSLIVDAIKPHTFLNRIDSQMQSLFRISIEIDAGMNCSAFVVYCQILSEVLPILVKELIAQNLLHVRIVLDIFLLSPSTDILSTDLPCLSQTIDAKIDFLDSLIARYEYLTKFVSLSRRVGDLRGTASSESNITISTMCKEDGNEISEIILLLDRQSQNSRNCIRQSRRNRDIVAILDQSDITFSDNNIAIVQSRLGFNPLVYYMDTPENIKKIRGAMLNSLKSLARNDYTEVNVIASYIAIIYDSESHQSFSQLYLWAVKAIADYEFNRNIPFRERLCFFIVGGILTTQEYEYLDSNRVLYWHVSGTVKPEIKRKIFSGAIAALNMHQEPLLSLHSLEAMACGCPIIAMYEPQLARLIVSIFFDSNNYESPTQLMDALRTHSSSNLTNGIVHFMHSIDEGFEFRNAIRQLRYSGHGHSLQSNSSDSRPDKYVSRQSMELLFDFPEAVSSREYLAFRVRKHFTGWRHLSMSILKLGFPLNQF